MLQIVDQIPSGFLEIDAKRLYQVLPQPTLVHLLGTRREPVFISVLLHGNEDVGLKAVQRVLKRYAGRTLPRSLSIFVANIEAARQGVRRLPGQADYNRVWPGSELPDGPEKQLMAAVFEEMKPRKPFASIDLHNNTGTNPHYSCICDVKPQHLQLASLFSRTVVYFIRPKGVQTMAFMSICPSITCECGKVGDESGVARAVELLQSCLHAQEIPNHPVASGDVHLFHTVATVKVPPEYSIGFGDENADLVFPNDLDHWNFCEIGPAAEIAFRPPQSHAKLLVVDEHGEDRTDEYISVSGNSLRLKKKVLPSMLTLDHRIIRQDCLCYFMERFDLEG